MRTLTPACKFVYNSLSRDWKTRTCARRTHTGTHTLRCSYTAETKSRGGTTGRTYTSVTGMLTAASDVSPLHSFSPLELRSCAKIPRALKPAAAGSAQLSTLSAGRSCVSSAPPASPDQSCGSLSPRRWKVGERWASSEISEEPRPKMQEAEAGSHHDLYMWRKHQHRWVETKFAAGVFFVLIFL